MTTKERFRKRFEKSKQAIIEKFGCRGFVESQFAGIEDFVAGEISRAIDADRKELREKVEKIDIKSDVFGFEIIVTEDINPSEEYKKGYREGICFLKEQFEKTKAQTLALLEGK